jgi:hypothetical protein
MDDLNMHAYGEHPKPLCSCCEHPIHETGKCRGENCECIANMETRMLLSGLDDGPPNSIIENSREYFQKKKAAKERRQFRAWSAFILKSFEKAIKSVHFDRTEGERLDGKSKDWTDGRDAGLRTGFKIATNVLSEICADFVLCDVCGAMLKLPNELCDECKGVTNEHD